MELVVVAVVALLASGLTMFSGFGLGSVLLPVFALFMPVELAVAATALVHGANNLVKALLLGRLADGSVVLRFGVPAMLAAFAGAWVLGLVSGMPPLARYQLLGRTAEITPVKLFIGALMIGFALLDLLPRLERLQVDRKYLPLGGLLSGFFGGISGHQGALRSAFLAKVDITPQGFVGTNAVIAVLVDLSRLVVYGAVVFGAGLFRDREQLDVVVVGALAAFAGVLIGKRLVKRVTMTGVRRLVAVMLLAIAALLVSGLI